MWFQLSVIWEAVRVAPVSFVMLICKVSPDLVRIPCVTSVQLTAVAVGVGVWVTVGVKDGVGELFKIPLVTVQGPQPGKLKVKLTPYAPTKVWLSKLAIHIACVLLPFIAMSGAVAESGEV